MFIWGDALGHIGEAGKRIEAVAPGAAREHGTSKNVFGKIARHRYRQHLPQRGFSKADMESAYDRSQLESFLPVNGSVISAQGCGRRGGGMPSKRSGNSRPETSNVDAMPCRMSNKLAIRRALGDGPSFGRAKFERGAGKEIDRRAWQEGKPQKGESLAMSARGCEQIRTRPALVASGGHEYLERAFENRRLFAEERGGDRSLSRTVQLVSKV